MLTPDRLKELLYYNSQTGEFFWKKRTNSNVAPGDLAGHKDKRGYCAISVDGKPYGSHRLAWLYSYGKFPREHIDHINRDPSDNRIVNLREATRSQNQANRPHRYDSKTGYKGVIFFKPTQNYRATIWHNGKQKCLGYFKTAEMAYATYTKVAKELKGEFFHA